MSITSDMPALEAELADVAPWLVGRGIGKADLTARQGSAIWEMKGQDIPPTLIMQGEKDESTTDTGGPFRGGCQYWGVPFEMAVYPRERHLIKEMAHLIDMLKRVVNSAICALDRKRLSSGQTGSHIYGTKPGLIVAYHFPPISGVWGAFERLLCLPPYTSEDQDSCFGWAIRCCLRSYFRTNHQGSRREKLDFFSLVCTPKPPELGIDEKESATGSTTTREIQPLAHQLLRSYIWWYLGWLI